jgi:hypothetical protein
VKLVIGEQHKRAVGAPTRALGELAETAAGLLLNPVMRFERELIGLEYGYTFFDSR